MVDVLTVVNDDAAFRQMTFKSLALQRQRHALRVIDNTQGTQRSASAALNAVWPSLTGDWVFVVHQDIVLDDPDWLGRAVSLLSQTEAAVAGVAGARADGRGGRELLSNITDGTPPQRHGHVALSATTCVQTVDECAFFVDRRQLSAPPFDSQTCAGWHLYAVDLSLTAATRGLLTVVLPLTLYHRSGGGLKSRWSGRELPWAYYRCLRRVARKHRDQFPQIVTTCGVWHTRRSVVRQAFPRFL